MSRIALLLVPCLLACRRTPEKGAAVAPLDDTGIEGGVEWPGVDTTAACPAVDFTANGSYTLTEDVVYDIEDGEELLLNLYLPEVPGPRPGVVMVHGGGFTSGSRSYMSRAAEHYASAGFVVLNVEYRRIPTNTLDALSRDVLCSMKWGLSQADALGLDSSCLGTMGESAGGYLAAMAAMAGSEPTFSWGCDAGADLLPLARWSVPYYGIFDIPTFAEESGLGALMPGLADLAGLSVETLSPTTYVGRDPAVGFFLPHGTNDDLVPHTQSEVFEEALLSAGHPVELRLLDGVSHGFMTGDGFWGEANQAVQQDIEAFVLQMNAAR